MAYTKQQWLDNSIAAPYGPISAARLNHIEAGIAGAANSKIFETYGAIGDGNTDDTAAIQSALNDGGVYRLTPGATYKIGTQLVASVAGTTIIQENNNNGKIIWAANAFTTASNRHMLQVLANDFAMLGVCLDGNLANQTPANYGYLIQLGAEKSDGSAGPSSPVAYSNHRIEGCRLVNGITGHIRAFNVARLWVEENYCFTVTSNTSFNAANILLGWVLGFDVRGNYCDLGTARSSANNIFASHSGNAGDAGSKHGLISGNECLNCTDSPIEASGPAGTVLTSVVEDVTIANNRVRLGAGIISLQAKDIRIIGNEIRSPGVNGGNTWGVRIGCTTGSDTSRVQENIVVANNVVYGDSNGVTGIQCQAKGGIMRRVTITDNHLVDLTGAASAGISVDGGSVASPNHTTNFRIADNNIINCGTPYTGTGLVTGATVVVDGSGSGTPEGAVFGTIGSTWRRNDGGASTSFYVKESGLTNTGWVAK